jgi:hypothetical protein
VTGKGHTPLRSLFCFPLSERIRIPGAECEDHKGSDGSTNQETTVYGRQTWCDHSRRFLFNPILVPFSRVIYVFRTAGTFAFLRRLCFPLRLSYFLALVEPQRSPKSNA